jgi:Cu(I)/Ag(I) efflux system periplasmic protein CusF
MKLTTLIASVALVASGAAFAQATDHSAHHASDAASATAPQSEGEVRKVDKEQGKVTLRHGPLQNLDMPGMTMVFKAANPKLIDGLTEGDKVKFTAEKVNGVFTVTAIQPVK